MHRTGIGVLDQTHLYAFGPFRFDPVLRTLTRDGAAIPLTPKAADLLDTFLSFPDDVLSKDDLLAKVWPGTFVGDGTLPFHIHLIRHALDDDAANPNFIQTVQRRGYRFVAPVQQVPANRRRDAIDASPLTAAGTTADGSSCVTPLTPAAPSPATSGRSASIDHSDLSAPERPQSHRLRAVWVTAAALIAVSVATASAIVALHGRVPPLRVTEVRRVTYDGHAKESVQLQLDDNHLLVNVPLPTQVIYALDGTGRSAPSPFGSFHLIDVSRTRGEALATRSSDPGAEHGLWIVPVGGGAPRPVGQVRVYGEAAWSNDGRRIAYVDDQHTLWVTDTAGSGVRRVASFSGSPGRLTWSPNDRVIRASVEFHGDRTFWKELVDVAVAAGTTTEVLSHRAPGFNANAGAWVDDSDYVFCRGADVLRCHPSLIHEDRGVLAGGMSSVRELDSASFGGDLVPSFDGRRFFGVVLLPFQLSRYDDTHRQFVPYLGGIPAFAVAYAPHAAWMAYITTPDYRLWRADADGSHARPLTPPALHVGAIAISPDARWIALRRSGGAHSKIYVMPSEGGPSEPIVPGDVEQGSPTWSADGTRVAFGDVPETFGHPTGSERIHIYDRRTKTIDDVPGSNGLWSSRWSPDGRYLAALTIRDQALELFDFVTSTWRPLPVDHTTDIVWSPDGSALYCYPDPHVRSVRRVSIPDGRIGAALTLPDSREDYGAAGLSRDGAPLFLVAKGDVFELHLNR